MVPSRRIRIRNLLKARFAHLRLLDRMAIFGATKLGIHEARHTRSSAKKRDLVICLCRYASSATVEQSLDNSGVEYVKGDLPCASLQSNCARSGAGQAAVFEPAFALLCGLDLAGSTSATRIPQKTNRPTSSRNRQTTGPLPTPDPRPDIRRLILPFVCQ